MQSSLRSASIASIVTLLAVATGCGTPKPKEPAVAQTWSTTPFVAKLPSGDAVVIAPDVRNACKLDGVAPKFGFDSTAVTDGRDVLNKLAVCLTTGPLRGKHITLVGRADSRGEGEYNMALGGSRASAVAGYLHALGVASNAMQSTSRGELDANGHDEDSWARDRRVDIGLRRDGG
jgi:peptidoglycan-associated lipoprotein